MLEKLPNGVIVDLSKIEYIGILENFGGQRLFEIIINGGPKMFKFIGQSEKATETYNYLIDRIKVAGLGTV
ncbi:hypothetical protein KA977_12915 [Candidatus Dependentiae bacterium]|nr:hypothetical protein [Candidatus Dependentiae bacterium]